MSVVFEHLEVRTEERTQLVDVTDRVEKVIVNSGVSDGMCLVNSGHTTTAIIINENEANLKRDLIRKIGIDFPRGGWGHDNIDNNADAHLASAYLGASRVLPVKGNRLVIGTWQSIFLLELDGPRRRSVLVEVMGD